MLSKILSNHVKTFTLLMLGFGTPLLATGADTNSPALTPIVVGLNNPRGVAFGPDGSLYVTESGLGAGDGHGGFGEGVGHTGSIIKVRNVGKPHASASRVVTGLASLGTMEQGPTVLGADGISIQEEAIYVVMAESISGVLEDLPEADPDLVGQFGQMLKITPRSGWHPGEGQPDAHYSWVTVADVGDFSYAWTGAHKTNSWAPFDTNPTKPQFPDANPYGVLAVNGHRYVVDAAANTVNEVMANGLVRLIAYVPNPLFPNPQPGGPEIPIADSVPTCVALGPDGYLYIGTLAFGANFARGATNAPPAWKQLPKQSKVYRVKPSASKVFLTDADVWAADLNPITACGFGGGAFYAIEFMTQESGYQTGDVVKIAWNMDGTAGARTALGTGDLHQPNGFAWGPDEAVYLSNYSTSAGKGEVVRINP